MNDEIRQAWNSFADTYRQIVDIRTDKIHYGPLGPDEDDLQLLGNLSGRSVIELGCGAGQNSVAMAHRGAQVTGVDFAERQLQLARNLSTEHSVDVNFVNADLADLSAFPSARWDVVLSCFAIEYLADIDKFFSDVHRLLRPNGLAVICDLHPFVSSCDLSGVDMRSVLSSVNYFDRSAVTFDWPAPDRASVNTFTRFHRTVEQWFKAIARSGLVVTAVREPPIERRWSGDTPAYSDETITSQYDSVWKRLPYTLIVASRRHPEDAEIPCIG
ncbi:class I SAM-dependent methyltransferase [Nocardia colli]|uniref:class I SAM-dependent methyltransferase n=1 Tax=Nocardia colli TaxID=2545717 RepID=UPI0035E2C12B